MPFLFIGFAEQVLNFEVDLVSLKTALTTR